MSIELLVHELGIEEWVVFTGHLSAHQFASHLAGADIGVSPYCGRVEYSGLKLLDYKSAGLADYCFRGKWSTGRITTWFDRLDCSSM